MSAWEKQSRLLPPGNRSLPGREERIIKDHTAFIKWQSRPVLTE